MIRTEWSPLRTSTFVESTRSQNPERTGEQSNLQVLLRQDFSGLIEGLLSRFRESLLFHNEWQILNGWEVAFRHSGGMNPQTGQEREDAAYHLCDLIVTLIRTKMFPTEGSEPTPVIMSELIELELSIQEIMKNFLPKDDTPVDFLNEYEMSILDQKFIEEALKREQDADPVRGLYEQAQATGQQIMQADIEIRTGLLGLSLTREDHAERLSDRIVSINETYEQEALDTIASAINQNEQADFFRLQREFILKMIDDSLTMVEKRKE